MSFGSSHIWSQSNKAFLLTISQCFNGLSVATWQNDKTQNMFGPEVFMFHYAYRLCLIFVTAINKMLKCATDCIIASCNISL